jgi:hypothetical protein
VFKTIMGQVRDNCLGKSVLRLGSFGFPKWNYFSDLIILCTAVCLLELDL